MRAHGASALPDAGWAVTRVERAAPFAFLELLGTTIHPGTAAERVSCRLRLRTYQVALAIAEGCPPLRPYRVHVGAICSINVTLIVRAPVPRADEAIAV